MSNFKDLSGCRFGRLSVVSIAGRDKNKRLVWLCCCDCGRSPRISSRSLVSGQTQSCGCRKSEVSVGLAIRMSQQNIRPNTARNRVLADYKCKAKLRHLNFGLTGEEFDKLIQGECYWCGGGLSNTCTMPRHTLKYNGIDRLDNFAGYTSGNCVSCCRSCNIMKNDLSEKEFLKRLKRILDKHPEVG